MSNCRDWSKTMLAASYKGVPFYVDQHEIVGGRRISIHEFTNRDNPFNEDLGGTFQPVTVNAYVSGDNADAMASALFGACTSHGAGTLILPLLGSHRVHCVDVKMKTDYRKLGRIQLSMNFVKDAGLKGGLTARINPLRQVQVIAQQARQVVSDAFSARYGVQDRLFGRSTDIAKAHVADEIRLVAGLGLVALEGVVSNQGVYASINREAITLAERADTLSRQIVTVSQLRRVSSDKDSQPPYAEAGRLTNALMGKLGDSVEDKRALFLSLAETLPSIGAPSELAVDLTHASITRRSTAKLVSEYRTVARQAMAIAAMQAAGEAAKSITSRRDARFIRARMGDVTDRIIAEARSQEELAVLSELRGVAAQSLKEAPVEGVDTFRNNNGRDKNHIGNAAEMVINASRQLPATYWGWRLYGDPARAQELIERNDVPHPSFMPYDFEALGR
jgi:prophage DNA circulation protein